jgi:Rieske Fe-S protein
MAQPPRRDGTRRPGQQGGRRVGGRRDEWDGFDPFEGERRPRDRYDNDYPDYGPDYGDEFRTEPAYGEEGYRSERSRAEPNIWDVGVPLGDAPMSSARPREAAWAGDDSFRPKKLFGRRSLAVSALVGAVVALVGERAVKLFGASSTSTGATGTPTDVGSASGSTKVIGKLADVPLGSGKIFAAAKVVVTQPTPGVYRAFSAVCTHAGCVVDQVKNGKILCPCHPGVFNIADGTVTSGPPPAPLPPLKNVAIQGDNIVLE